MPSTGTDKGGVRAASPDIAQALTVHVNTAHAHLKNQWQVDGYGVTSTMNGNTISVPNPGDPDNPFITELESGDEIAVVQHILYPDDKSYVGIYVVGNSPDYDWDRKDPQPSIGDEIITSLQAGDETLDITLMAVDAGDGNIDLPMKGAGEFVAYIAAAIGEPIDPDTQMPEEMFFSGAVPLVNQHISGDVPFAFVSPHNFVGDGITDTYSFESVVNPNFAQLVVKNMDTGELLDATMSTDGDVTEGDFNTMTAEVTLADSSPDGENFSITLIGVKA